jgi:cell division protein FtsB
MSHWVAVYRFGWILLVLLAIVGLLFIFLPKYNAFCEMRKQQMEKKDENRRIEARISDLRTNQERFLADPAFVERTARETGMVKPHETIYKHTNKQGRAESP